MSNKKNLKKEKDEEKTQQKTLVHNIKVYLFL